MLIKLELTNWRRLKEPTTFDFNPPITFLNGKNDSAKESVREALEFLKVFILQTDEIFFNDPIHRPYYKYKLANYYLRPCDKNKPTEIRLTVKIEEEYYRYFLIIKKNEILDETLELSSNGEQWDKIVDRKCLSRTLPLTSFLGEFNFSFGDIGGGIIAPLSIEKCELLTNWFEKTLCFLDHPYATVVHIPENNPVKFLVELATLLNDCDYAISSIYHNPTEEPIYIWSKPRKGLNETIGVLKLDGKRQLNFYHSWKNWDGTMGEIERKIYIKKKNQPEDVVWSWNDEPDSLFKLIKLSPIFMDNPTDPKVYVINNFNDQFHTLLTTALLNRYLQENENKKNKQLIFTSTQPIHNQEYLIKPSEIINFDKSKDSQ